MAEPESPDPVHDDREGCLEHKNPEHEDTQHEDTEHEDTGHDLARQLARGLQGTGPAPRRRRRSPRRRAQGIQSSGPRPDGRDPQLIGEALDSLLQRQGWSRTVNLHLLLGRWSELVGVTNAAHSRPERYAEEILTVRADSSAWATQLRAMAPQLVARLNDRLGQGTVTRIQVLGPDAPSWKHGPRSVRDGRGPRDTYG